MTKNKRIKLEMLRKSGYFRYKKKKIFYCENAQTGNIYLVDKNDDYWHRADFYTLSNNILFSRCDKISKLQHRNIMKTIKLEQQEMMLHITEYNKLKCLQNILYSSRVFSVKSSLSIVKDCIKALQYAWDNYQLVHNFVFADNIFLCRKKVCVFFPIDKRLFPDIDIVDHVKSWYYYLAPEIVQGKEGSHLCDIYSLGVLLYRMLSGVYPFKKASSSIELYFLKVPEHLSILSKWINLFATRQKSYPDRGYAFPLEKLVSGLDNKVAHFVQVMMEPNPKNRFQSYDEVLSELEMLLEKLETI